MVIQAEEKKADIVIGKYHRWKENGESVECRSSLEDEDPDSIAFRFKGFFQSGSLSYNWGKLYRRAFLTENIANNIQNVNCLSHTSLHGSTSCDKVIETMLFVSVALIQNTKGS